jgi:Uncharacterized protein conserved in bacteria (DUF2059)
MTQFLFHMLIAGAIVLALPSGRAVAQDAVPTQSVSVQPDRVAAFVRTMQIPQIAEVMRAEGVKYGTSLETDMFGGKAGAGWQATVSGIYDAARMTAGIEASLLRTFAKDEAALAEAEAFFGSDLGKKVLTLEVDARRAMLDDGAKDAAELNVLKMTEDRDPRLALLKRFAEVNDLTEMNVAGAMTSNLSFYQGMQSEGAFGSEMTEDQMMSDVWAQEPQVRADSEKWLMSFLALAYAPLSDADLNAYITFSETTSGQRFNTALFAAFDDVFRTISHDLGAAAARQMKSSDI